jgi:GT2 family glycosyltransferase
VRYGLALTTYARPQDAMETARSSEEWSVPPTRVVVANNSSVALTGDQRVDILDTGVNVGLPAALGACFRALDDCDAVLVLDDDTLLAADTAQHLLVQLDEDVGIVGVPRRFTAKYSSSTGLFPWSPSVVSRVAIERVGVPRQELFFGLDDWDYGTRVVRAGLEVRWVPLDLPQQSLGASWDGRSYLSARNAVYLAVWKNHHRAFWRLTWDQLRVSVRPGVRARVRRRGLLAGLLRRMGPPPPDLMPEGSDRST